MYVKTINNKYRQEVCIWVVFGVKYNGKFTLNCVHDG